MFNLRKIAEILAKMYGKDADEVERDLAYADKRAFEEERTTRYVEFGKAWMSTNNFEQKWKK